MRNAILALVMMTVAATCFAAPPPKYLDVDVNWQQTQELETLNIQQGASMRLRVRPKIDGKWLTLTGLTARWEARETATNTSSYQATSNLTSNEAHWVQIELDNTQTGTALTSWLYSVILIDGADEYPIGIGTVNVVASDFAGSSSVLVGSGYETNSVDVTDTVSTINFSTGITAVHDGTNKLTLTVAGDNLGNHTATKDIDAGGFSITNVAAASIGFVGGVSFGSANVTAWNTATGSVGTTYTAGTNLDLNADEFDLDAAAVASLALADSALQSYTETDPIWVAVSNTVTANALLGSTALQSYTETDPVWVAASNGVAYLDSIQTFTGFNTFDDGSYQVDLLPGSKAAYFDDASLTHWVHIVNGTYGIKAEVGGASSLIAGQYTDGTRVVNLGDNMNGYAVNVTAGASYFDGMVDLNTDALAGTDAVSWSVLTNQIALLAPAGTTNLAGLQDVADLSGVADTEALVYDAPSGLWTNGAVASAGLSWVTNSLGSTNTISVDVGANTYHLDLDPSGIIGAGSALDDLSDVDVSAPSDGDVLVYTSGSWTNAPSLLLSNVTVDIAGGTSLADAQALIDAQPKNLNGYTLTFDFEDGFTYAWAGVISFKGFSAGALNVVGDNDITTLSTAQDVTIKPSVNTYAMAFYNVLASVTIKGFKVDSSDQTLSYTGGIHGSRSRNLYLQLCYLVGDTTSYGTAFYVYGGGTHLAWRNYISNCNAGIYLQNSGQVYANDVDYTGTQPSYSLRVEGGNIHKTSSCNTTTTLVSDGEIY